MKILESPLMGEFIGYLKANWGGNSRVSQRRRRLRQLVAMVRGVADAAEGRCTAVRSSSLHRWLQLLRKEALRGQEVLDATADPSAVVGSARKFLAGVRALFVCGAEVDRLTDAVEGLERLTGPGCDLDLFLKVLQLDAMDVDVDVAQAAAAPYWAEQESYSAAGVELPVPGAKRKRAGSSGEGDDDDATASHGRLDRAYQSKRRALAFRRHPTSDRSSLEVAGAMARVRRRIGKPNLGPCLSRMSLH